MQKCELLAPCGSVESVNAALYCGADAIYIGLKSFSARQNAVNFDFSELDGVVSLCHLFGVKVYAAVNTLIFDSQLENFAQCIVKCAEIGVDAFIVQDLGAVKIIKTIAPDARIHASTQLTVHTPQGAEIAKKLGFSRVVVSRELSKAQIEKICKTKIEVEAFVHGALCMSVSGQCYMSAMFGSRSANRGLCAQPCRLPFCAKKGGNEHCLSLKDLSLAEHIGELEKIGVRSLKIEGRMKRPEYVAASTEAYRSAIDLKQCDLTKLNAVFSRQGFTDGYFTSNIGKKMFGVRNYENVLEAANVQPDIRKTYEKIPKIYNLDLKLCLSGNILTLFGSANGVCESVTFDISPYLSMNPLDCDTVKKQLSKLGNTVFELGTIEIETQKNGYTLPISGLNAMRRDLIDSISKKIIKNNSLHIQTFEYVRPKTMHRILQKIKLRAYFESALQALGISSNTFSLLEFALLPLAQVEKYSDKLIDIADKVMIVPPRFINDEETTFCRINNLRKIGFKHLYCNNIAYISQDFDMALHGGFNLNCTNSESVRVLKSLGLCDIECSFELKTSQISKISHEMPIGMAAYGKLPLMLTKNCPIGDCEKCLGKIFDRKNLAFDVKCPKHNEEYAEILNTSKLEMADKLKSIDNVDFATLLFYDESVNDCEKTIQRYLNGEKTNAEDYTRGLYYRGVK